MAARTPGLQPRSQYHSYWGRYTWDNTGVLPSFAGRTADPGSQRLPNAPLNIISATEWAKLEAGDIAATASFSVPTGSEYGLFTCIFPGSSGGGDAVWVRCDNISSATQTVRDAHVIVVAQEDYLTALAGVTSPPLATNSLNLSATGDVVGVTCDYLDPGDGSELDLALAAALAGGIAVDIRLRPCDIVLTGGVTPAFLTVPAGCRLIGAGMFISNITGTDGTGTVVQNVLTVQDGASVEDLSVFSPAPVVAPAASPVGVIQCSDAVQILRCSVQLHRSTTIDRNGATNAINFTPVSTQIGYELVDGCQLFVDSLLTQTTPAANSAISFGVAGATAFSDFDPEVRNTSVDEAGKDVGSCQTAVSFVNVEGGRCFNVEHYNAYILFSFSWAWAFAAPSPVTRKIRGPKFIECRGEEYPTAVQIATNQFGFFLGIGAVANNLTNGIYGAMFHDCAVKFAVPTTPSASASLRGFVLSNASTDNSDIYDTTIDNCRVENGHRDFIIAAASAGRIESLRMTACQGRDTRATGSLTPRGAILTGNPVANNPTVIQVGIQNCDFTGCPATGVAVDIEDIRVENTIVLGNNLTPAGGTAIADSGTGTEAAHNIVA